MKVGKAKNSPPVLTREQDTAIREAIKALKAHLSAEYPFEKAGKALKRWAMKGDPAKTSAATQSKKRHGNAGHFKRDYFPIIAKLHAKYPERLWTRKQLAGCLIEYIEKVDPNSVPSECQIEEGVIRKQRLRKYMSLIVDTFGIAFTGKPPSK